MKPNPILRCHTDRVLLLRRLSVALLVGAGAAMGQTAAPIGVAKPAEYDCSGLEGVALTSCRQLNAAAVGGALITSAGSPNSTHDCAGMSGASLATCQDLNGQIATPPTGANGGGAVTNSLGSTTSGSNPSGAGIPAAGSTIGGADTTGAPATGSVNSSMGQQVPATAESLPAPGTPLRNAPSNGQVPPPSDRIVPVAPAAGAAASGGAKAGK